MALIAVIEDEKGIRENIEEILWLNGYESEAHAHPNSFLERVQKQGIDNIDLIISDIIMPEIDGIEMIEKISKTHKLCKIPIVYLTALNDEETIEKAYDTSTCALTIDYVIKPFRIKWFIRKIQTLLDLKKKTEELAKANDDILRINLEIQKILDSEQLKNEYLLSRMKTLLSENDNGIEKKLKVIRELMPKLAVNDLSALKFVAIIIQKSAHIINKIAREPDEEDEFFKILPQTEEALLTAIWDIEQSIKLFIDLGIIDAQSISSINFETTSFYEILLNKYKEGTFSEEHFKSFLEKTKFQLKGPINEEDVILF